MDPSSNPKPKAIATWAIAILAGLIALEKPWLVEHLGINQLSLHNRLVLMLALAVICAICIVIFKILNRPKPHV